MRKRIKEFTFSLFVAILCFSIFSSIAFAQDTYVNIENLEKKVGASIRNADSRYGTFGFGFYNEENERWEPLVSVNYPAPPMTNSLTVNINGKYYSNHRKSSITPPEYLLDDYLEANFEQGEDETISGSWLIGEENEECVRVQQTVELEQESIIMRVTITNNCPNDISAGIRYTYTPLFKDLVVPHTLTSDGDVVLYEKEFTADLPDNLILMDDLVDTSISMLALLNVEDGPDTLKVINDSGSVMPFWQYEIDPTLRLPTTFLEGHKRILLYWEPSILLSGGFRTFVMVHQLDDMECAAGARKNCDMQEGVCSGNYMFCTQEGIWPECDYSLWNEDYETNEALCDGLDNDCDGSVDEDVLVMYYRDDDGDNFGIEQDWAMDCPIFVELEMWAQDLGDCNDVNAQINPGMQEVCADGIDNNCNELTDEGRLYYRDDDGDNYGTPTEAQEKCEIEEGWSETGGDCDDVDGSINPGATEACDGLDNNCDNVTDEGCSSGGGNSGGSGSGGGGSPPPCTESWTCTDWGICRMTGSQTRTCEDENSCGTANSKPELVRSCTFQGGSSQGNQEEAPEEQGGQQETTPQEGGINAPEESQEAKQELPPTTGFAVFTNTVKNNLASVMVLGFLLVAGGLGGYLYFSGKRKAK